MWLYGNGKSDISLLCGKTYLVFIISPKSCLRFVFLSPIFCWDKDMDIVKKFKLAEIPETDIKELESQAMDDGDAAYLLGIILFLQK